MEIVILDVETLGGDVSLAAIEQLGRVVSYPTTTAEQTPERIASADVVITNKVMIDAAAMEAAKNLKLICVAATGMNNIDLAEAAAREIPVKNVAGYSTASVAQHTFAMFFYLAEQLRYYDDYVKSGAWTESQIFTHLERPFVELEGKTWGIIGLGAIGRQVAKIAQSFGATVVYASTSGAQREEPYARVKLAELLAQSDVVSIHAPLNENTRGLIAAKELAGLKAGAVLLNLGRGGIVDEPALAKALDSQDIFVGLDVLEQEPMAAGHPLLDVKNKQRLYITPHIAWASLEARQRLVAGIAKNIVEFNSAGEKSRGFNLG